MVGWNCCQKLDLILTTVFLINLFCLSYNFPICARDYAYPRPIALATAQVVMAIGHFFFAMAWPGTMYIGTLLIGLGYGAHWAIVPAAVSELFGLKYFGTLYNFMTAANPAGSLIFSGIIASGIYDSEAAKQAKGHLNIKPNFSLFAWLGGDDEPLKCEGQVCFFLSSLIMASFCIVAMILSIILVIRTKIVYKNLYGNSRTWDLFEAVVSIKFHKDLVEVDYYCGDPP